MPFFRADPEFYDELISELEDTELPNGPPQRASGEFEYEAAEAKFDPAELGGVARLALDALRGLGATAFRVRYDGGYDEGFAHADSVRFGRAVRPAGDVAADLAAGGVAEQVRDTAKRSKRDKYLFAANFEPAAVAREALYLLAHELASKLLGEGFGTGEYELYGAFTADLATGRLTDDPKATKPKEAG